MAPMSYIWSTELLSLSMLVRSGGPTSVINVSIFLAIYSSTLCELLGKQILYGYHSCANEQVKYGHVCSSLSAGALVVNPSIVPSVATKIRDSAKGLSWTIIPYACNWLGFTRVWSMVSPIQIALLRIRIVVSPVSLLSYTEADWTIGTAFMVSYASVYGATSHYLPVNAWQCSWSRKHLCPRANSVPSCYRPLILGLRPIPSSYHLASQKYCPLLLNESSRCSLIHYCFLLCVLVWWIGSWLSN